ncbi:MAG: isoprenylcysteine carboxylmethyltransferase family protein [Capsulimonadaceae bacterium]|nr:isoprenylcysteine carboxylmethyltransferase family protein [Capsulimonadaceae bacterium]
MRFLARRRTTFTWLIPLGLLIVSWFFGKHHLKQAALGVVFLILGEIVRTWAAGCIHKDNVIATTGPYSYVRNPLYFGSFLFSIGYALLSGLGLPALVVIVALFMAFHLSAIVTEEVSLTNAFGEPYTEYMRHVPRIIPRLWPYKTQGAEPISFSWSQVVYNREPTTAMVTLATAIVFGALQYYHLVH